MNVSMMTVRVAAMVVAALAIAHRAHALIYVKYFTNSPSCQSGCISPYQAGSPITINLTNDIWLIYVYSTIGTEDIGRITLTGTGTNLVSLVIGQDGSPTVGPLGPGQIAGANWAGLDNTGRPNVRLNGRISGNLTGPVISSKIATLRVDGVVNGAIAQGLSASDTYTPSNGCTIIAGSFNNGVHARSGHIARIETISGDLLGSIVANGSGGYIQTIDVAGDVGTPSTPRSRRRTPGRRSRQISSRQSTAPTIDTSWSPAIPRSAPRGRSGTIA